jgi:hypothetical protein
MLLAYVLILFHSLFLSYVLDLATHSVKNSASWRVPVGLQLVWGLALLSGIFFLPESPYVYFALVVVHGLRSSRRHLLGNGKKEEARQVIAELNGVPLDDALVTETVEELQFAINEENAGGKATWAECFSSRNAMWKRTGNGMMLQFIQQLNGQNFYCKPTARSDRPRLIRGSDYYGDTFFKSAGTVCVGPRVSLFFADDPTGCRHMLSRPFSEGFLSLEPFLPW